MQAQAASPGSDNDQTDGEANPKSLPLTEKLIIMNAHHPYHSAQRNLRTVKTPVVLRNKRRKWALSLSLKRLSSMLLLYFALLAGPTVITAQTLQASPLASTASAENVVATARDKVQPNLSIAIVPDHAAAAAGGSSFIKRAVRGVLRFTKSLFSVFGEGGTSNRKVEPKSKDQDEVTISSAATVYSPGLDRPEGSAKVLVNAVPPKLADEGLAINATPEEISKEKSPDEQISIEPNLDAAEASQKVKAKITYCTPNLANHWKLANLTFNSLYSFRINEKGEVIEITKLRDNYIGEESVKACLATWKIVGVSGKSPFVVYFNWKHGEGWGDQQVSGNGFSHVINKRDSDEPEITKHPEQ
jgi:hypothetical protein